MSEKMPILIVDDDELILALICAALKPLGCPLQTLDDGLEVLNAVTRDRPQLIILDCSMPGLSGMDALRQVRASDECFDIPVLMLTARRGAADEAIAKRAGADHYVRKPFDPAHLLARVEFILADAKARATKEFTPKQVNPVNTPSRLSINLA